MNSVHQETKPTYVLIVRSPCSRTRNHHHPRQHDHGTPRSINLSRSVSVSKSHLCQSKGNIGGPGNGRLAHGMGKVYHIVRGGGEGGTLDLQSWQICGIGANVFYITHSSVTCTKNNQCEDRRFEVHCYLKHAILSSWSFCSLLREEESVWRLLWTFSARCCSRLAFDFPPGKDYLKSDDLIVLIFSTLLAY